MPTVIIVDGFRVIVNTTDHAPAHVHVLKAGRYVRLRLDDLRAMGGDTMRDVEIRRAQAIVADHIAACWETWRRFHD